MPSVSVPEAKPVTNAADTRTATMGGNASTEGQREGDSKKQRQDGATATATATATTTGTAKVPQSPPKEAAKPAAQLGAAKPAAAVAVSTRGSNAIPHQPQQGANGTADSTAKAAAPKIFDSADFVSFLKDNDIAKFAYITRAGSLVSTTFEGDVSNINSQTIESQAKTTDFWRDSKLFSSFDELKSIEFFKSVEGIDPPSLNSEKPDGRSAADTTARVPVAKPVLTATNAGGSAAAAANAKSRAHLSKEWTMDYGKDHVDVNYEHADFFKSKNDQAIRQHAGGETSKNLPPKKRSATTVLATPVAVATAVPMTANPRTASNGHSKTDWNEVYKKQLGLSPALIEAANQATPVNNAMMAEYQQSQKSKTRSPPAGQPAGNQKRRRLRKVIPKDKEFVDSYTDEDVLFGRGGRSNHHPGNKIYRDLVTKTQTTYRQSDKHQKTKIAISVVENIQQRGGRFLELDKATQRWYVVPQLTARRKAGQALRENNTEEARKAKRERYSLGKKSAATEDQQQQGLQTPAIVGIV